MDDFEKLAELIRTRRSIRKFQQRTVPENLLLKAIELATWAPNGGNFQPWKFVIISNRNIIEKIADAVRSKMDLMGTWPEAESIPEFKEGRQKNADFFREAPVCVAVFMKRYSSPTDRLLVARQDFDPFAQEIRSYRILGSSGLQSVAAAVANLLLVLHCLGLGATWMAGPQVAKKEIESLLNVPAGWDFVDLIPVGYPAEDPPPKPRKPVYEVVEFVR